MRRLIAKTATICKDKVFRRAGEVTACSDGPNILLKKSEISTARDSLSLRIRLQLICEEMNEGYGRA